MSPRESSGVRLLPAERLSALLALSSDLASSLDAGVVMQTAIDSVAEVMGLDTGAIYLVDGEVLQLGATFPSQDVLQLPEDMRSAPLHDHPHIQRCLAFGGPVYVEDIATAKTSEAERAIAEARDLRSVLYVPLIVQGVSVGTLIVGSTRGTRAFGETDIQLCRALAYQVALSVANARLFESVGRANEELVSAYDATLEGWSLALEMRDEDTKGHTERVVGTTIALARRMGIPEHELPHLRRGSLLHDIGKMVVPDTILHKPGPLTEEEWEVMRTHPERARALLSKIAYLRPALDVPYCHHERWDGTGYPQGLSGEEIPLSARVFAIVDVFDALTSDRPYREAWPRTKAIDHIRKQSGRHFDPAIVREFLGLLEEMPAF